MLIKYGALTGACLLFFSLASIAHPHRPSHDVKAAELRETLRMGRKFDAKGRTLPAKIIEKLVVNPPASAAFRRDGIQIRNAHITGELDLHTLSIPFTVDIKGSQFDGKVNLNDTKFNSYVNLQEDNFSDTVDMSYAHFNEGFYLDSSTFHASLDLSYLADKEEFSMYDVTVMDTCVLYEMRVGFDLTLTRSTFLHAGLLNAGECVIGGSIFMDSARVESHLQWSGSTIGSLFNMSYCYFGDYLECVAITCGNQLYAEADTFYALSLNNSTVKRLVQCSGSTVQTDMDLSYLNAGSAQVYLTDDSIGYGTLDDMETAKIDLSDTRFNDGLKLSYSKTGMLVLSPVDSLRTRVDTPRSANPGIDSAIDLTGLTYNRLIVDGADKEDNLRRFLRLLERIPMAQDSYVQLEQHCKNRNFGDLADDVYIDGENRASWGPWQFLKRVLIGYGRKPFRVLWYAAVFVLIGYFVFRQEKYMEPVNPDEPKPPYSPFWYTFDLFIPGIKLDEAEKWMPKQPYVWMHRYRRLLGLLGWLLIPIGLAGISGLIK